MPHTHDYSEIYPIDPHNPFRNPTEEPDYTPDYREILPELDMPESRLTLFPSRTERSRIRRAFSLTFLTMLFDLLLATSVFVLIQLIVTTVLQQRDLRELGTLPQNYSRIVQQFFSDSSISYAGNLIAFLIGNGFAVFVGCKLTNLKARDFFRLRDYTLPRGVTYILIGLWIQILAEFAAQILIPMLKTAGIPIYMPTVETGGTWMRTAMLVLYSCLIAPVTEELLLRGVVLKNLSRVSQRFGILLSALLFGIMHENLAQFLFTFPLGILLGYITVRHNSLTPAIFVHIAVNTASVALSLCSQMLNQSTFRIINISYTLGVVAIGSVAALYLFTTERLPDQTPHQSLRCGRIAAASPLLWILVGVHLVIGWIAAQ